MNETCWLIFVVLHVFSKLFIIKVATNIKEHVVEPMASAQEETSKVFTSGYQFLSAQSNNVPGSNQDSSTGTFANQHSIQGLQDNSPDGMSGPEYSQL